MTESTPIVAFDQHAASVMAAVLMPGDRTPALTRCHRICRASIDFSVAWEALAFGVAMKRGRADLSYSGRYTRRGSPAT